MSTLTPSSPLTRRRTIWSANLRTALRWCWPLDTAVLAGMTAARALTLPRIAPATHPTSAPWLELNPVIVTLTANVGALPAAIGTALFVLAALVIQQTLFVPAGKWITRLSACILLLFVTADVTWDLLQLTR
jgi:hypothetical protein